MRRVAKEKRTKSKKKTVEEIARKHKLETALVEQVVRLYVTHPGVTADGIMTKMVFTGILWERMV